MDARITPAYAGKSGLHDVLPVPAEDHPRLCGEKFVVSAFVRDFGGSPPPMRGKVEWVSKNMDDLGITPAYAGKSSCHKKEARGNRDHPRLCGEKPASSSLVMFQPGSPPPMRGKVLCKPLYGVFQRITPAYAGKRCRGSVPGSCTRDHPRLCGEKSIATSLNEGNAGSPPPMRGKERY